MAGSVINASVKIGKHVIINTCAVIEHDNFIEDYVHISPNATLCVIGELSINEWNNIRKPQIFLQDIP